MRTPVSHEQGGQEEKPEVLITARRYDSQLKWLPILEYEESGPETKPE